MAILEARGFTKRLMGAYRRRDRQAIERDLDWMFGLLPILPDRQRQRAGSMIGGEQQMCAIARSLMARPRTLILDEPSLGLAPIMLDVLVRAIGKIHAGGTTILVVEQDVAVAFDLAGATSSRTGAWCCQAPPPSSGPIHT